jgi:hypothetical protein
VATYEILLAGTNSGRNNKRSGKLAEFIYICQNDNKTLIAYDA